MRFLLIEDVQEKDSAGNILSPEQIKYFKNSKIRDASGNLLVCSHGTDKEFMEFKYGDGGFHFGTSDAAADRQKYKDISDDSWHTLLCYLNITNPYTIDFDNGQWSGADVALTWVLGTGLDNSKQFIRGEYLPEEDYIPDEFINDRDEIYKIARMWSYKSDKNLGNGTEEFHKLLYSHGYDGIKYWNTYEGNENYSYIAFKSNQVKSILNKRPTAKNSIMEKYNNKG